jgi:phosphate transport system permease protein
MLKIILNKENIARFIFLAAAYVAVACVILICVFLFTQGVPPIAKIGLGDFLFGEKWKPSQNLYGILPMTLASIYTTVGAIVIGAPIGILTATFLSYFCPQWLYKVLKPMVNLMAGIPSIVYGFFGMAVLVPFVSYTFGGNGKALLTASILLGVMILPTIISVSESAIRSAQKSYYEGAVALGASHEISVFKVILPAAKSGIISSVILGIGRAIGETMAVVMVAGNQAIIPTDITRGARTLTSNIVIEMAEATDLHRAALIGTAVVLFVLVLIINLLFSVIKTRRKHV